MSTFFKPNHASLFQRYFVKFYCKKNYKKYGKNVRTFHKQIYKSAWCFTLIPFQYQATLDVDHRDKRKHAVIPLSMPLLLVWCNSYISLLSPFASFGGNWRGDEKAANCITKGRWPSASTRLSVAIDMRRQSTWISGIKNTGSAIMSRQKVETSMSCVVYLA